MPFDFPLDAATKTRLEAAVTEMKSDKFWRDMAQAIDKGMRHCREESEAFDSVSAKEYRKQAITAFGVSKEQLDQAAQNKIFVSEAALVTSALLQLKGESADVVAAANKDAEAKATIDKANTAAHDASIDKHMPEYSKDRSAPAAPTDGFDEATKLKVRYTPFTWEQDEDGVVTLKFMAPPETAKGDIGVSFGPQRLKVTMKGHPLQPAVVDSDLLYPIVPGDSSWAVEGKGAKRCLVVTLEKAMSSVKWAAVLDNAEGQKQKKLTEMVSGLEGLDTGSAPEPMAKFSSD